MSNPQETPTTKADLDRLFDEWQQLPYEVGNKIAGHEFCYTFGEHTAEPQNRAAQDFYRRVRQRVDQAKARNPEVFA